MNAAQAAQPWNISIFTLVHTDADIDKIQLEIQAGSKAASKIIDVASSGAKEEDATSPYDNIQAKLKKILGIENMFKVRAFEYQRGEYFPINEAKGFWCGKLAWESKDFGWREWD